MTERLSDRTENQQQYAHAKRAPSRLLTCDEVAWIGDIVDRHATACLNSGPGVSRTRKAAKLAALLELMDILDLGFADRSAAGNAIAGFPELYILRGSEIDVDL